jgi:hypothetical protein
MFESVPFGSAQGTAERPLSGAETNGNEGLMHEHVPFGSAQDTI